MIIEENFEDDSLLERFKKSIEVLSSKPMEDIFYTNMEDINSAAKEQGLEIMDISFDKVTRIELSDYTPDENGEYKGLVYSSWKENSKLDVSLQDSGRTLKIMILPRE